MVDLSAITGPVGRLVATAQNGLEVLRYGGLETGAVPSPFQIIESVPMYRLRRYFPPDSRPGATPAGPPVLMVHPMMMSADMWDVTRDQGAVGILHKAGIDPWVIDFGSPDKIEGGMQRNLADHVVALSQAIDTIKVVTGRDVHVAGYSQGGMFAYQTAAYRRSKDLASIIAFGSPVDTLAALPMNLPASLAPAAADFMADHVFSRIDIPGWLARTGFQMLDPIKTAQSRLDFLLQLHDREALLPREQQRRFLASEGWIAWSGPAISELLKQFIAHNRMMTGGFSIHGDLVTLSDIDCPVLAVIGEVDDIGQPASVRGIKRAAPQADVYEFLIRAGHFGLVVGSKAATRTWPTVAAWVRWLDLGGDMPEGMSPMPLQPAANTESGVPLASRVAHGTAAATEMAFSLARSAADALVSANKSARALAVETARTLPRLARLGQINDHTRISLGRIMSEQARDAPHGECLLFDGRVHTYEAVDRRINNVVRGLIEVGVRQGARVGVLMETRPSALVAIAALSRLGAVAVLMPPDVDLATAARLGGASEIITDPGNLDAARALDRRVLVLGGGESRDLHLAERLTTWLTWRRSTPTSSTSPAGTGPTRDWRVIWRSSRSARSAGNSSPARSPTTGGRCRRSAPPRRPPQPQRHRLLPDAAAPPVGTAGQPRRCRRRRCPHRAVAGPASGPFRARDPPVRRHRGVLYLGDVARRHRRPGVLAHGNHPVRLFIGSGMPDRACGGASWRCSARRMWSSSSPPPTGRPCWPTWRAPRSAARAGRYPVAAQIELAAYDPERRLDPRGRPGVCPAGRGQRGRRAACPPARPGRPARLGQTRGVRAGRHLDVDRVPVPPRRATATTGWSTTVAAVIRTARGPVFAATVNDAVGQHGCCGHRRHLRRAGGRPDHRRDGADIASRRQRSVGRPDRGTG